MIVGTTYILLKIELKEIKINKNKNESKRINSITHFV
jgi:hypothetical protein